MEPTRLQPPTATRTNLCSRFRRRQTTSFESVHPACLDSITHLPHGQDHSAYFPDHGTSAVRDPSCPQAPVFPGTRRPPVEVGLLLQVAQATTTHSGMNDGFRGISARRVVHPPRGWLVPEPDLTSGSSPLTTRGHRHQLPPRSPDPARLKKGIAYQAGGRHGPGQASPRSSSRAPSPRCKVAVACHVPIRLEGRTRTLSGPSPAPTSNLPTPQIPVRVGLSLRPPGCRQVAALLIPSCSAAGQAAAWT